MSHARRLSRFRRRKACTGKIRYPSRRAARLAAKSINLRHDGLAAEDAQCPFCGSWHVRPLGRNSPVPLEVVNATN